MDKHPEGTEKEFVYSKEHQKLLKENKDFNEKKFKLQMKQLKTKYEEIESIPLEE